MLITVEKCPDGSAWVELAFYDEAVVAAMHAAFRRARYDRENRRWHVPGPRGYSRACKWAEPLNAAAEDEARRMAEVCRQAEAEGRLHEVDPAAALAHRRGEIRSQRVTIAGATVCYPMPYNAECVEIAKSMPNRRFRLGAWHWTARTVADVDPIIDGCNRIFVIRKAEQDAEAARKAEQARAAEQRRAEQAARVARRYIVLAREAPAPGAVVRLGREAVVIESLGKAWPAGDDVSSRGGPIGCEGELVRYAYYREASEAEREQLEQREQAAEAAAARAESIRRAVRSVAASTDAPVLGQIPDGEVLWRNDRSAAVGYWEQVILSDGWLWHVIYDGSDGATWGQYNLGQNTRGVRVPATDELLAALRPAADAGAGG